jgi:DNA polymerase-3 subunit alpha (Gram-positive type)
MDALITPQEIIDTAIRWGHRAIAVTDHGNVQAYPEVMLAYEKAKNEDLKILYGIEAYYVNDTERCVFGSRYPSFDDEMIVFDLETTGLSSATCEIIEIGAVKVMQGEIVDRFSCFVKPDKMISQEITDITSITNDDVKDAKKINLNIFVNFVGLKLDFFHKLLKKHSNIVCRLFRWN